MGSIRAFNPVKLFVGVLVSNENLLGDVESQLSSSYGPVDHRSPVLPFTFTDYYRHETGERILRVFLSFELLIDGGQLPEIKRHTNVLEETLAASDKTVKRPVNLDPGYLEHSKVILHRRRIFITECISRRSWRSYDALKWSLRIFPMDLSDYKSTGTRGFLELDDLPRKLRQVCAEKHRKRRRWLDSDSGTTWSVYCSYCLRMDGRPPLLNFTENWGEQCSEDDSCMASTLLACLTISAQDAKSIISTASKAMGIDK
jgi:hypothetical protein